RLGEVEPGRDLGQPLERDRADHQSSLRSNWLSSPRVCAAPPRRAANVSRRAARASGVSLSSASERTATTSGVVPCAVASWKWRSQLPSPKAGLSAVGGV